MFFSLRRRPRSSPFPYTTLFRSVGAGLEGGGRAAVVGVALCGHGLGLAGAKRQAAGSAESLGVCDRASVSTGGQVERPEEIGRAHVELQSPMYLVCRLLLEKRKR